MFLFCKQMNVFIVKHVYDTKVTTMKIQFAPLATHIVKCRLQN